MSTPQEIANAQIIENIKGMASKDKMWLIEHLDASYRVIKQYGRTPDRAPLLVNVISLLANCTDFGATSEAATKQAGG